MSKNKREIIRFIFAGFSAVGTDFVIYFILINVLSNSFSKIISFVCGTIVAYLINKYWTFEKHKKSLIEMFKFFFLYLLTLSVNVITNKIFLNNFNLVYFSFLIATGISTILNFIGQKWWVFR